MKLGVRRAFLLGTAFSFLSLAGFALLNCVADEDTSVTIVKDCNADQLSVSSVPETTVKVYLQTMKDTLTRAQALERRLQDVCNAMNRDLGLPEGTDLRGACNKVAARVKAAIDAVPIPDGSLPTSVVPWVVVNWDRTCPVNTTATAECLDQCSGGATCNPVAACQVLGTSCEGTCNGTCSQQVTGTECVGACAGKCEMNPIAPPDSGVDAGPRSACNAECVGRCSAASWNGRCSAGCTAGFVGQCTGTCTGRCDGVAYPSSDAGAPSDDGGDGGVAPAQPGSGSCAGRCEGSCSGPASGRCAARCNGDFSGGICTGLGACSGACNAESTGCVGPCTGVCTTPATTQACGGTCAGRCEGTAKNPSCAGELGCDANRECKATCEMRGALATTCRAIAAADVRIAGDSLLYDAISKHIIEFANIANEVRVLVAAYQGISNPSPPDFKSIGLVTDRGFRCVDSIVELSKETTAALNRAEAASSILKGTQF
jgi:hypothetical protein